MGWFVCNIRERGLRRWVGGIAGGRGRVWGRMWWTDEVKEDVFFEGIYITRRKGGRGQSFIPHLQPQMLLHISKAGIWNFTCDRAKFGSRLGNSRILNDGPGQYHYCSEQLDNSFMGFWTTAINIIIQVKNNLCMHAFMYVCIYAIMFEGVSWGEGRWGKGIKRDGRVRMPEA